MYGLMQGSRVAVTGKITKNGQVTSNDLAYDYRQVRHKQMNQILIL